MKVVYDNLMGAKNFYKRPIFIFLAIYFVILYLPAAYLNITQYNEALFVNVSRDDISKYYHQNFVSNTIFLVGLLLAMSLVKIFPTVRFTKFNLFISEKRIKSLFYFSALVCSAYFFMYGIDKLERLGTEMVGKDFRIIGFDDVPVVWALSLELTRKVIFPLLITYFFVTNNKRYFWLSIFFFLMSALATLDRFPFLIILMFSFYSSYQASKSLGSLVIKVWMMIVILGLFASVLTYVQHNQLDVDLSTIVSSATDFLLHRVLTVPTFAATEIGFSYADLHGFFNLQYSRLGFLFGAERIGFDTAGADPYFVAPVGVVADVFRNFGYPGVCLVSLFLGWFVAQFSKVKTTNVSYALRGEFLFMKGFLMINLATYLVFGNFFSLGLFAVLASCVLIQNCRFEGLNNA